MGCAFCQFWMGLWSPGRNTAGSWIDNSRRLSSFICWNKPKPFSVVFSFPCLVFPLQAASSALSSLGHVYTAIGDYPNALASHKQCVLLAKQSKDELSEARELGNMGAVYIAMGDFENAVQCHEQHLRIAKDLGSKREEARAYSNLGSAYHYRRNFDKAMSYHNCVLELAQELMEKSIEMRAYAGLGHAARCMQDLERAKQYHEQQLGIAEDLKDRAAEGRASSNLGKGLPLWHLGQWPRPEMAGAAALFLESLCVFVQRIPVVSFLRLYRLNLPTINHLISPVLWDLKPSEKQNTWPLNPSREKSKYLSNREESTGVVGSCTWLKGLRKIEQGWLYLVN